MKHVLIFFLFCSTSSYGQIEKELPLTTNPSLIRNGNEPLVYRAGATFDSTFIYTTDTLTLPFFDDFSKNKFQTYDANYGDPGVTFDQKFALLDVGSIPLPSNAKYSLQPTYKRTVTDVANNIFVDTLFASINIQIGSLATYPVTYNSTPVYPPYIIFDTLEYPNPIDSIYLTIDIVEQDSATQFFSPITDPSKLWLDSRAYHNYRFAVDPWTIGVATFDGLDENGYPYSFGANGSDYADVLTSKPINLSMESISDSIYFSFLYQKQGFGEEPESNDSLTLEIYDPTLNLWSSVWGVNGGPVSDFESVHLPIVNPNYFANGFQFRFRNYGSLAGGLDHFHVDYVAIRKFSNVNDTVFKDFAFVYPTGSLLKDYTSVPWDHYKNNASGKMNDATEVVVRNGSNLPENNQDGDIEISYGGIVEGNFTLPAQTLSGGSINYAPKTTYFTYHDLSGGYQFDVSKPGKTQTFDIRTAATAQFTDSTVNDTTYTQQYFADYYSYDDGTPERAYSFNPSQGRLAMQFTPYEGDTLIGASIHFTPSVVNAEGDLFVLTVWDDNGGVPGDTLFQDDLNFPKQVEYLSGSNRFENYYFSDLTRPAVVNGPFYIGWRQFDASTMNVGLDKNNDNSDKLFYSLNGGASWTNSSIEGTVMIRPIFSTSVNSLNTPVIEKEEITYLLYPNPATNQVTVSANMGSVSGLEIFNLQGRLVGTSDSETADVSYLNAGVYLVRPLGSDKTLRLIKK